MFFPPLDAQDNRQTCISLLCTDRDTGIVIVQGNVQCERVCSQAPAG